MTEHDGNLKQSSDEKQVHEPVDNLVETRHSISIGGVEIAYTVTAGTIVLKEEEVKNNDRVEKSFKNKPKAEIFFVAYTRDGVSNTEARPVTFSFNGGPGSSSVWLHLGLLGPKRVDLDEQGNIKPPPFQLVENQYSLLDQTDLVFIDPVSTGFSRAIEGEDSSQFHGFKKDIESVGDFIRLFLTRYQRWTSPKFIIGESYGTTRAAGLAGYLQERHGLYMNGIMLISSVLDFSTIIFTPGNDLPYILFLPTYAATGWFHKLLPEEYQRDLYTTLEEVKSFAAGEYALALMKGQMLTDNEKDEIAKKLAQYTGLSEEYIHRTDLRINIYRFVKELLRHKSRTVGRLDSRFQGVDRDAAGEFVEFDPSMANITGPYTATLYDYVTGELNFTSDLPYEILTSRVHPWSYADFENKFVNVAETLRSAISQNPFLKVFVANGFYDLATPFFATEYTFSHLGLDPAVQGNISMSYYEAGHMMYIHLPSLEKLKEDLSAFIRESINTR